MAGGLAGGVGPPGRAARVFAWRLPPAPPQVAAATSAGRVLWDLMIAPLLPYLLVLVVLMALACVVFGLALNYVLLERAEQQ